VHQEAKGTSFNFAGNEVVAREVEQKGPASAASAASELASAASEVTSAASWLASAILSTRQQTAPPGLRSGLQSWEPTWAQPVAGPRMHLPPAASHAGRAGEGRLGF
jgi:hypothetical protein